LVRVIMGVKGSGKTKQLIELVNGAAHSESGNVICIEHGPKLIYDVHYKVRLVEASQYEMISYERLKGFISGLYAGNFDISHIFIDSLCKIIPCEADAPETEQFLDWLEAFSEKNGVRFTVTISADVALAPEGVRKYF
jgi:energy-coupling factor transporter ATP-binding protein EcfA2